MNNSIRYTFIALGFAIIIPIGISIFLIKKSYELERKKFDIEVSQFAGNIFFSSRADYDLLDSVINQNFFIDSIAQNQLGFEAHFKNELLKVYRNYEGLKDTLQERLKHNDYHIEFEYLLEISDLRIIIGDTQKYFISDSVGVQKQMVLFGNLTNKKTAASYSFYHIGSNNYIMLKLYIDYPGRNQFLIKRIWSLIVGILFSMLVLILILVYTIKILFWQKKVSDMKSHFIDNITHEFNTPVSTLKIIAANIKKLNLDINSKALEQISVRVENQASRLSDLIGKVMSLSVNEKGNINYEYKVQHLNELLVRNAEKHKQVNREKIKSLKIEISAENDEIIADDYYFSIAILNILDNAVKYSDGQAEIYISTNNLDDSISLSIKDKGIGMKPSEIKQVFKRFYRGGSRYIYKAQGLGLGLSIVKQIVNAHKGKIFVESKVDHGTEFKIVLPLKCVTLMDNINENLLEAAKNGDLEAVKKAIGNGADVNATDPMGKTAMILTINTEAGYYIVKFLLENGADVLAVDKNGKNVKDHLIMPEKPPEHHENAYEAWIHCGEHYTYSFLSRAMEEKQNLG